MFEEPVGCMFKMVEEKRYQRKWDQRNHDHFTFVISNCGNINKNYAERFNDREKGQASFTYLANQVGRTNIKISLLYIHSLMVLRTTSIIFPIGFCWI